MIWLFDLDNTLYPYSSGMYQHINLLMNQYLKFKLNISLNEVDQVRKNYIQEYGTTLLGMMKHYNTEPEEFLNAVHSFEVTLFLKKEKLLREFLATLTGAKYIFTNSPLFYAKKVLSVLGILDLFSSIFSIEFVHYYGKPNPSSYKKVLDHLSLNDTIAFVDDEKSNIETARDFGWKTCLIDSKRVNMSDHYQDELFPKVKGIK